MRLSEYQQLAMRTCSIPYEKRTDKLIHGVTGLVSELYEFKKAKAQTSKPNYLNSVLTQTEEEKEHVIKELGDCMWMIAEICDAISDFRFEEVVNESYVYASKNKDDAIMEICGMIQKTYQGHAVDTDNLFSCLCAIENYLEKKIKSMEADINAVLETNISKLRNRYPEGFSEDRSLNRAEGDV